MRLANQWCRGTIDLSKMYASCLLALLDKMQLLLLIGEFCLISLMLFLSLLTLVSSLHRRPVFCEHALHSVSVYVCVRGKQQHQTKKEQCLTKRLAGPLREEKQQCSMLCSPDHWWHGNLS